MPCSVHILGLLRLFLKERTFAKLLTLREKEKASLRNDCITILQANRDDDETAEINNWPNCGIARTLKP